MGIRRGVVAVPFFRRDEVQSRLLYALDAPRLRLQDLNLPQTCVSLLFQFKGAELVVSCFAPEGRVEPTFAEVGQWGGYRPENRRPRRTCQERPVRAPRGLLDVQGTSGPRARHYCFGSG